MSDIKAIYLGSEEVSSLMLGSVELWTKEGTPVEIIDSYHITAVTGMSYCNTTEYDESVLVVQTNIDKKIEGVTATTSNGTTALRILQPIYLGNGTYAIPAYTTDSYSGYGYDGEGNDSVIVTVPGMEIPYTFSRALYDADTDHAPLPRNSSQYGFCRIQVVPFGEYNYTWSICGFAFDAQDLVNNGTTCSEYRYSKTMQKMLYRKYELRSVTTFPKNGQTLASAQFGNVSRGDTDISVSINQNSLAAPRLGYVELSWTTAEDYADNLPELGSSAYLGNIVLREIIFQDGLTQKIGFLDGRNDQYLIIDLDELNTKDFVLTKKIESPAVLYFYDQSLTSKIEVYLDSTLITPTNSYYPPRLRYKLESGDHTITIKKKSS